MKHVIVVSGLTAGAGVRSITQALAHAGVAQSQSVLVMAIDENATGPWSDPARWVPAYEALDGSMLRQAMGDPDQLFSQLRLYRWPESQAASAMIALLERCFDWMVIEAPRDGLARCIPYLERADLWLWSVDGRRADTQVLEPVLTLLSKNHLPKALGRVVLNRLSKPWRGNEWGTVPVIGQFLESSSIRFEHELKNWAADLKPEWFLPRASNSEESSSVEAFKARVQPQLLTALEQLPVHDKKNAAALAHTTVETLLAQDASVSADRAQRELLFKKVMDDVLGLGPLEVLLRDPDVSEVMVNGPGAVFIERRGRLESADVRFPNEMALRTAIERIVAPLGRRVDESTPMCDARLADGSRVNIVLPPLALDGPTLTIRKFAARTPTIEQLLGWKSFSEPMAVYLTGAVRERRNIIVSGGTGSGKTTLLNALSGLIPDDERIVTIEDAAELRLAKPHVVRLESRPPNAEGEGAIPIRRLVINALRMRPDRIVVGECRSGEALDMLQAMNTGHDGSMTTLHANSPRDALGRLETLVLMAGMDLPVRVVREQIRSAVHVVLQQARLGDGSRKIISITEITGMEGDLITTQELFRFRRSAHGDGFESTGVTSHYSLRGAE